MFDVWQVMLWLNIEIDDDNDDDFYNDGGGGGVDDDGEKKGGEVDRSYVLVVSHAAGWPRKLLSWCGLKLEVIIIIKGRILFLNVVFLSR